MNKIGILGGTFDPIHSAHIKLAKSAMEQFSLNEVRFMTAGVPPHKNSEKLTPPQIRHKMTELALMGEKRLTADNFEISKTEYSYTVKTLTELNKLHPDWNIHFIIGEDSLLDFPKWYKPERIVKECKLLVYPRMLCGDINELVRVREKEFDTKIGIIDAPFVNVSSTMIRKLIAEGKPISDLVPDAVCKYIEENGLYRS